MKHMTLGLFALFTFLFGEPIAGQPQQAPQPCTAHFVMYRFIPELWLVPLPAMTTDQSKWFEKKGVKKFPGFCQDAEKATYVMVTITWTEESQETSTKTKSAYTTGPVTEVVGVTASGPGRPAQPIWGTQLGTFVTTWQEKETEIVHKPRALVLTFETKDGKPLSGASELKPNPVTRVKGIGRNASRDALEQTLEFLTIIRRARADAIR